MQTINPFEVIMERLDQLQSTVNLISITVQKNAAAKTDTERLLDLTEAAQIIRKPVGTMRYYIHHRSLPATKVGKSYLIRYSLLLEWVSEFDKQSEEVKQKPDPMLENRKRYRKN